MPLVKTFLLITSAVLVSALWATDTQAGSGVRGLRQLELGSRGVYAPRRAAALYCAAAEAGDAEAAFALGRLYLAGRGVRRR